MFVSQSMAANGRSIRAAGVEFFGRVQKRRLQLDPLPRIRSQRIAQQPVTDARVELLRFGVEDHSVLRVHEIFRIGMPANDVHGLVCVAMSLK